MSCSLNFLKGIIEKTIMGVIQGDTRSLHSGSHRDCMKILGF